MILSVQFCLKLVSKNVFVFILFVLTNSAFAQVNNIGERKIGSDSLAVELAFNLPVFTTTLNMAVTLDKLIYHDNFNKGLHNWIIECELSANSKVEIENESLNVDVDCGATIWFKEKLKGNLLIQYKRTVIMKNGANDRLSDLNTFWMATDPAADNLFTRNGVFSAYHNLQLYYAGIGGNSNSTTRFRKYSGTGERILHFDDTDIKHLLQANKTYLIDIVIYNGTTMFFVDNELYFKFTDIEPLTEGYFGFRTVKSHQKIDDFKIYRLNE